MAIDAINKSNSYASYQGSSATHSQKDSSTSPESKVQAENITVEKRDSTNVITRNEESGTEETFRQSTSNSEQLKKAVENLNNRMGHSEALFGIHDETNRVIIKIVDKETKEVIKELPPEKTLDMIAKAWELAGLLIDEKR